MSNFVSAGTALPANKVDLFTRAASVKYCSAADYNSIAQACIDIRAILTAPYISAFATVHEAVVVGDVIAIDVSQDVVSGTSHIPYVGKVSTITTAGGTPKTIGVVVLAGAALATAQYAIGGMLTPDITGLSAMTGGAIVSVNTGTSKLQAAAVGDDPLGYTTPNGCVLLEFLGRISS